MNDLKNKNLTLLFALTLLNILFIIYYSTLIYYNRLAQDDYDFLFLVKEQGIFGFVKKIYTNHQGRFSSFIIQAIKYSLINSVGNIAFVPIVNWLIDVFSLFYFLTKLLPQLKKRIVCLFAASIINLLLIINFEFSSFFWIASSEFVVVSSPLLLFTAIFFNKKKHSYIIVFLLALLIGGWSEAFAPLILFFLLLTFFSITVLKKRSFGQAMKQPEAQKILLSFIIIFIGLVFVMIAPGNANRLERYQQPASLWAFWGITAKNFAVFVYLFAFRMPYVLFAPYIAFIFGLKGKTTLKPTLNHWLYSLAIMIFVIWCSTFPAAFIMSSFGFHRIYTPIIFWLLLFCCFWAYLLGTDLTTKINEKRQQLLSFSGVIFTLIVCGIQVWNIRHDTPIAKKYSETDKARIELFMEEKKKGRTVDLYVAPLSSMKTENFKSLTLSLIGNKKKPVLYYSNEIDSEIVQNTFIGYNNSMMMQYYELPFAVYLKKQP
ncbi:MAG: hypothetical protein LBH80_00125 [Prevotellaceae bacterium]|jgi:hypothetical protein|nr:hypothetical protein [Prevotellaceae bacterium]